MVWGPAKTPEPPARTFLIFWLLLSLPGEPAASQVHTYSRLHYAGPQAGCMGTQP